MQAVRSVEKEPGFLGGTGIFKILAVKSTLGMDLSGIRSVSGIFGAVS